MANEEKHHKVNQDLEVTPPTLSNHGIDALGKDEAIAMVGEHQHDIDPAVVARAVRKIDWFLIPAMIFGCASLLLF